jgi:tripartite-type tricarboxylate transporter receptor subunit TctC
MKIHFRIAAAIACSVFLPAVTAIAQDYPSRSVRIILPFPPGGGTDVLARVLALRLTEALGQTALVDNRPGASGNIGAELTAKSPPDGHTIMITTSAVAANVTLYTKSSFDPRRDLVAITQLGSTSSVLSVHPSVPVRSPQELVALSKHTKGGLNFGSNGSGTSSHLAGVMFGHIAGAALNHVPYKGAAPALNALLGGEVEVAFPGVNSVLPMLRAGKVRVLAVSTKRRSAALPDLPTLDSIYPGVDVDQWFLSFVPAGTPQAIVTRLHAELTRALQHPEVKTFMSREGIDPVGSAPADALAFLNREIEKIGKLIKLAGIKAE